MSVLNALNNLVTSVQLNLHDSSYQLIYTTQLYGTTFSVFANFSVESEGEDLMRVKEISFIGVNYKGPININIKEIEQPEIDENDRLKITLVLQADDLNVPYTSMISKVVDIQVNKKLDMTIDRDLIPMNDNFNNTAVPIEERAFRSGKFDSEFYMRDGIFIVPRHAPEWVQLGSRDIFDQTLNQDLAPGRSCVIGKGKMWTSS
ncbi:MAG: hypothetical protein ACFB2Y_03240 [Fulvivirga sp.]